MRNPCLLLLIVVFVLAPFKLSAAADTVAVRETRIPVLIERQDNELFHLRIEANQSQMLDEVKLNFGKEVNLAEIEAVKLYYGGTESVERRGKTYFAPVDYISSNTPGKTLAANASYSVLKSEVKTPKREVVLNIGQKLFPGVNYFWISLQMKPTASILSKVSAEVVEAKMDGQVAPLKIVRKTDTHYMGVGVRHAGDDGAAAYRIPGLVTSNKGTLLGVYDVRYNNSADLQEYVEIGLSRSTDGGQTWEKMRIPMSFGEYDGLPKAQNGVGDPAILVDKKTGTIWIVAAWTHGMGNGRAWWNSQPGMDRNHTAQLMMVKSDDDGKTWSEPVNVTEQVKDPSWYFLLQGPGRGISMEDGTLVFASQYIGSDRIPNAGIIYSKDHGKTWNISTLARTNTTESQVAELEPGVLMLNMRDNRGGSRAVSTTIDMGKTWKEHESSRTALQEPVCMASLISVKAKDNVLGKNILLFSNPNDTKNRHSITIKASLDGGHTWLSENQLMLDAGWGWGYSCLTMIDKETVGILYESSVAHMTFQAIRLKDIIKTK
ncbi:sialidase family protein [Phocaeicola sp.]|uniref:sialidase family protein n=1 Tax=Phocaeicola sp. TaxID=2773926 RepID=UPI0023D7077A|nr:sialidase family protein [Phocaeicola sp.]MDE5678185.1 exo-alpha-sialidase [Phocaeicola sp.]